MYRNFITTRYKVCCFNKSTQKIYDEKNYRMLKLISIQFLRYSGPTFLLVKIN